MTLESTSAPEPASTASTSPPRDGRERPAASDLLAAFGDEYLSIQSLFQFCFVPGGRVGLLKELAAKEEWGSNNFVLLKYLAIHVRLAIEQERYAWNGEQIVLAAGRLCTPNGNPIYIGLLPNSTPEENPWVMNWVGERPSTQVLPEPGDLGDWPELHPGHEVVIAFEIGGGERRGKRTGIEGPEATQVAALSGAISWALHRGLAVRQIHGGGRGYFVPVYLTSRADLALAPDFVAPLFVQENRLIVRTLLGPEVAYSPARAVVERWEQLPAWLIDAWEGELEAEVARGSEDVEGKEREADANSAGAQLRDD